MKFSILSENAQLYSNQRLVEEIKVLGFEAPIINPWRETLPIHKLPDLVLHRCNGIHFDEFDLAYSLFVERAGGRVYNRPQQTLIFRDKLLQNQYFGEIPSFSSRSKSGPELDQFIKSQNASKWVCKTQRGCKGIGVHIFDHVDDLLNFYNQSDKRYIIQPYLEANKEIRCLFLGDFYLSFSKSLNSKGTFNYDGSNYTVEKAPEFEALCKKIQKTSGYFYGSVDFLVTSERTYFLELNSNPGLKSAEEVSGQNLAQIIVQNIIADQSLSCDGDSI